MGAGMTMLGWDRTLVKPGERVCVAVSGGADSTALLIALAEANGAAAASKNDHPLCLVLSAAHVHHGLRGAEADGDESFVRELCERHGVTLRVFRVDTAARQQADKEGMEEAARELRYQALRGLMSSGEADVVATAHTLDDQAETVVMKMLRGAWTEGLGGISPVVRCDGEQRIVRPMLGVRRSEIEAFLREREQPWREDATNADLAMTRNRVRHDLMPKLRTYNPGVDALLARTAEVAREEEAFWQVEVARILPQVLLPGKPVRGGGRAVGTGTDDSVYAVEIARLASMPPALRRRVLREVAKQVDAKAHDGRTVRYVLSSDETAKVLALAGLGAYECVSGGSVKGRIGSRLELHAGLRVERTAREVRFWKKM